MNPRDGLLRRVGNLARFDLMVNRGRVGSSGPVPMWRVWFVGFVIAVVGATAVSAAWHAEHNTDPSCVVCKLRHQPLAEVSGDLKVGPGEAEVAEALEKVVVEAGCWHMGPLMHSLNPHTMTIPRNVGANQWGKDHGVKWPIDMDLGQTRVAQAVIKPWTCFVFEPNACRDNVRVNLGGCVLVTEDGVEEVNKLATELQVVS